MPQDERLRAHCERVWTRIIREEGLEFLGWRSVPVDNSCLSEMVKAAEPVHRQIFIGRPKAMKEQQEFERRLYLSARSSPTRSTSPTRAATSATTRCRCRAARWSTRACSCPTRWRSTTRTCPTRGWPPRWRWCTSASPPTPSRRGSWPIPTAWSRTTARSTRCAATSTGWRRGRRRCRRRCSAATSPSCGRSPTRASRTPPASTTRSSSW